MSDYLSKKLNAEQLERLAFNPYDDYWCDIDFNILVYELLDGTGYQQFVFDDNEQQKFSFGIVLKTVGDLILRYKSIIGYDARYHEGDLPVNAQ